MRDYMDLGSTPTDEDCAQVGSPDYHTKSREECNRYIEVIRRVLGPEPEGARLAVKSNPHDFGSYLSVVCHYDDANEAATNYAYRCESDTPRTWDAKPQLAKNAVLQCADCRLVPSNQNEAAHGFRCNRCGGENWKAQVPAPPEASGTNGNQPEPAGTNQNRRESERVGPCPCS